MSTPAHDSGERRGTYRCPGLPGRQKVELRIGRKLLPARLVNESSGGFAAWLEEDPSLLPGGTAVLVTDSGSFTVRAVYVNKIEPKSAGVGNVLYRVGLERLGPAGPAPAVRQPARPAKALVPRDRGWLLPANVSRAAVAALVSLLIAITLAVGLALLILWNPPLARQLDDWQAPSPGASMCSSGVGDDGLSKHEEPALGGPIIP